MLDSWYVSNGTSVEGPIEDIGSVLRGVALEGWGEDRFVWRHPWVEWRTVDSLREVRALRRALRSRGPAWTPSSTWSPDDGAAFRLKKTAALIASASDDLEVVTLTLQSMIQETRATVGLAHYTESTLGEAMTRSAVGGAAVAHLGSFVGAADAALRAARLGATVLNIPHTTRAASAAADRLGAERLHGVALVPIYAGSRLFAVLEIGKHDHAFRQTDRTYLRNIARIATTNLTRKTCS